MLKVWLFILNIYVNDYYTITESFGEQIRQASITEGLDKADYFEMRLWSERRVCFLTFSTFLSESL